MIYETKHFKPVNSFFVRAKLVVLYILDNGELEVSRNEKVINEINLKGAMFGELSELLMTKRRINPCKTDATVKFLIWDCRNLLRRTTFRG